MLPENRILYREVLQPGSVCVHLRVHGGSEKMLKIENALQETGVRRYAVEG